LQFKLKNILVYTVHTYFPVIHN